MAQELRCDITGRCRELLESITPEERTDLAKYADYRLGRYGMHSYGALDLMQDAFCAIVRGLEFDDEGRKANAWAVENRDHFIKFVKGVIRSIAEAKFRNWKTTHQRDHHSADLMYEIIAGRHNGQVEYLELTRKLFKLLYERAPARLHATIMAWEKALDGKIPNITGRKHMYAVKALAQKILAELGAVPGSSKAPAWVTSGSMATTVVPEVTPGVNEPFDT